MVFEEYFTTSKRDKYNILCSIEAHEKNQKSVNKHKPINDKKSSGGDKPLSPNSTEESLKIFCLTLNFTDSWLKQFKTNYLSQTKIYCEERHKLFKKKPISLPEPDDCKNKRQLLLTDIGG